MMESARRAARLARLYTNIYEGKRASPFCALSRRLFLFSDRGCRRLDGRLWAFVAAFTFHYPGFHIGDGEPRTGLSELTNAAWGGLGVLLMRR